MKKLVAVVISLVLCLVIVIPSLVVRMSNTEKQHETSRTVKYKGEDVTIKVYMQDSSKVVEMSLEEYVKGVVAAEMPAEFELEALKAQAVAARTYAVKNMKTFGGSGLPNVDADVSTDHRQNQAWIGGDQLKARWGENYDIYWEKVSKAVEDTRGEVITYNGELINAAFHSTSGPRTASAKEVWGYDYPYLVSVADPWDQQSPRYSETKEFSLNQVEQALGQDAGVVAAVGNGNAAVTQVLDTTESGRVGKIRIGSKVFSGIDIREKLGLRSANFTVEVKGDKFIFKTIGYGHGVGLSQYGANGMAKAGKTYREILPYYYHGVALKNIFGS